MRRILFITGTRADYGKIKPLIKAVADAGFEYDIFATGMHMLSLYGLTVLDIKRDFAVYPFMNMEPNSPMDDVLANTISGLGRYVREYRPDMIVVHGDRAEALAGASVGAMNNILVAHIEGGELSGTVDGILRHAVSKLSHLHFVANERAAERLRQMGETQIYVIGSPDIDVMLGELPTLDEVLAHYSIPYDKYSILLYHPVTSELEFIERDTWEIVQAANDSGRAWVAIYPNNDAGSDAIIRGLQDLPFTKIPSMRFEYFLTLLKNADCILGNSSAGIREAPVYGVPTVNVGTRQQGRSCGESIINVPPNYADILKALGSLPKCTPCLEFGKGDAARMFVKWLSGDAIWDTPTQKQFADRVTP